MTSDSPNETFDFTTVAPSTAVVETVAQVADQDPTTLDPLYKTFDPDALDRLLRSSADRSSEPSVRFTYCQHEVIVRADGTVAVSEP